MTAANLAYHPATMVDANEITLEVQSTAETDWSTLIDRMSIPPAQVKRAVVFDAHDRLLEELPLPNGTLKEKPNRDDPTAVGTSEVADAVIEKLESEVPA